MALYQVKLKWELKPRRKWEQVKSKIKNIYIIQSL